MLNVTNNFSNMLETGGDLLVKAIIIFLDGTTITVYKEGIWGNGVKTSEKTCSGTFDIGSVSQGVLILDLSNYNGSLDRYDFTDAIILLYYGMQTGTENTEWVLKGTYNVDVPAYKGMYVSLECYDNAYKLDARITSLTGGTAGAIVNNICFNCGIVLANANFKNSNLQLTVPDNITEYTYRQALGFICQVTCNYAKCNPQGQLLLSWYDTNFENIVDGGEFDYTDMNYYQTGAVKDGGNFTDYTSGNTIDDGSFGNRDDYDHLYRWRSRPEIAADEITITGVKVTSGEDTYLYGSDGYVLEIKDNPFALNCQDIAELVGVDVVGIKLRGFHGEVVSNPLYEAGDKVVVSYKGNSYFTVLTDLVYTIKSSSTVSCSVESAQSKRCVGYNQVAEAIIAERKRTESAIIAYDLMIQQLTNLMSQSFGVYKTEEVQQDGSVIYYMHDKPTLAESQKVWKMFADALVVSNDGGETWNSGWDINGNAVMNLLSAIGINADWIKTGTIEGVSLNFQDGRIANMSIGPNKLTLLNNTGYDNFAIETATSKVEYGALGLKLTAERPVAGLRRKLEVDMSPNNGLKIGIQDENGINLGYMSIKFDENEFPVIDIITSQYGQPSNNIYVNGYNLMDRLEQTDTNTSDIFLIKQKLISIGLDIL